jgi:RecA-family ATPase
MSLDHDAWVDVARNVPIESELARRGIKLNGRNEKAGPCPKCGGDDRFSINIKKGVWNCRGCNKGGDVIELVRHLDGVDFIEACTRLAGERPGKANGKDYSTSTEAHEICTATFAYDDENGGTVLFVVEHIQYRKLDGSFVLKDDGKLRKTFRQKRPDPNRPGQWIYNVDGVRIVPYRLPELIEAIAMDYLILIVEGEAKVDFLRSWNVPSTCNAGGAKKWKSEHSEYLRGADVVILPDNDEPGRDHADVVGASLQGIAKSVRVLELPGLSPKQDIIDWARQSGTVEQLHDLIAREARPWTPREKPADETKPPDDEQPKLPFINMSNWDHEPVPEQEWAVLDRIPLGQTTLFTGEGGYGKSTIQLHLCAAHALGLGWLNTLPEPGPAIFFEAEDGEKVIHRRLAAIATHYGVTFEDMIRGGLHLISLFGHDAVLATPARNGKIEPTPLYGQLLQAAGDIKPKMIGIASSANVFAGSEIDRTQTQQFVGLLNRVALTANGAVALIAHPSLTGINTDTGLSGSTQWHNAVRARFYLKGIKAESGEQPDDDLREMVFKKNQFGPKSHSLILRYRNGLFLPEASMSGLDKVAHEAKADEVFLALLKRFASEGRNLSHNASSRTYAPTVFANETEAKKYHLRKAHLEAAMNRLFEAKKIHVENYGRPSRPYSRIAIKD